MQNIANGGLTESREDAARDAQSESAAAFWPSPPRDWWAKVLLETKLGMY